MNNNRKDLQIYDKEYHCWREGEYIGKATWVEDENIGDAFIRMTINDTNELVHEVFIPDEWIFV